MKEHCLIALWLCRCVQACLMLGCVVPQVGRGCSGVLGGVEISLGPASRLKDNALTHAATCDDAYKKLHASPVRRFSIVHTGRALSEQTHCFKRLMFQSLVGLVLLILKQFWWGYARKSQRCGFFETKCLYCFVWAWLSDTGTDSESSFLYCRCLPNLLSENLDAVLTVTDSDWTMSRNRLNIKQELKSFWIYVLF